MGNILVRKQVEHNILIFDKKEEKLIPSHCFREENQSNGLSGQQQDSIIHQKTRVFPAMQNQVVSVSKYCLRHL